MPNASGTAIVLFDSNDARACNGYVIADAWWSDRDNVWHDGADGPTCVGTDTTAKTMYSWALWTCRPMRVVRRATCGLAALPRVGLASEPFHRAPRPSLAGHRS
jgi:hypothetical protein